MRIEQELAGIENKYDVKILYARESGSRAWGFPSKDSDWDIRFTYVRPIDRYLSIQPERDVIEEMLEPKLDFVGWDLKKTLMLFSKSNPPLLEWLRSPYVYRETGILAAKLRILSDEFFHPRSCIHHYLHMAEGNFREYLRGDQVKIKKYFYVIRPVLACRWIEVTDRMPPMEYDKLWEHIEDMAVLSEIEKLRERKIQGDELDLEPRIGVLNEYLETKISYYNELVKDMPTTKPDTKKLDELFRETLEEAWGVQLGESTGKSS